MHQAIIRPACSISSLYSMHLKVEQCSFFIHFFLSFLSVTAPKVEMKQYDTKSANTPSEIVKLLWNCRNVLHMMNNMMIMLTGKTEVAFNTSTPDMEFTTFFSFYGLFNLTRQKGKSLYYCTRKRIKRKILNVR